MINDRAAETHVFLNSKAATTIPGCTVISSLEWKKGKRQRLFLSLCLFPEDARRIWNNVFNTWCYPALEPRQAFYSRIR